MGKLLKYEFKKTWFLKVIVLTITLIFEAMVLGGLLTDGEGLLGFGAGFLFLTGFFGVFIIGVYAIFLLQKDLNTKQSYMLFMTPNNSYKILGAKAIESTVSILLSGAFFTLLGTIDLTIAEAMENESLSLVKFIYALFGVDMSMAVAFAFSCMQTVTFWLCTMFIGFFAVVISSTFLNGKKHNGLISFIIFLFVSIGFSKLHSLISVLIWGDDVSITTGRYLVSIV